MNGWIHVISDEDREVYINVDHIMAVRAIYTSKVSIIYGTGDRDYVVVDSSIENVMELIRESRYP